MTFYITVLAIVFVFASMAQRGDYKQHKIVHGRVRHTQQARMLFVIASSVLVFVAGLRYYVGTDFGAYYGGYDDYADELWQRIMDFDEPGFSLIAAVGRSLLDDGACIIFLSSLITIGLCMLTIYRNCDELMIAILLYIFLGPWHGSFNGTRQYLATAVLFCGYRFLIDKKFLKYCFVVFLAFLCHKSAIVMIALYPAVHRKVSFSNLLILIVAAWAILNAYDRLFEFAGWIMEKEFGDTEFAKNSVNIIRIIVACAPAVTFYLMIPAAKRGKDISKHLNIVILHGILAVITMNSSLLQRVVLYTTVYQTLAIPRLFSALDKSKRTFLVPATMGAYTLFWFYEISVRSTMIPFTWIWER